MKRFEPLKALLMDNLMSRAQTQHGRTFVRLKESGTDAKLKHVDIYDVDPDSILIKLDDADPPTTLFKGIKGERQRCDYVLVTVLENTTLLVFFEMKSRVAKDADITRQFKGAACLLDYCEAALNRFHDQPDLLAIVEPEFKTKI